MSSRNFLLLKGLIALALVWGIAWGLIRWAGSAVPTVEKVQTFIDTHSLKEISDSDERKKVIANLASLLNAMDPSELRRMDEEREKNETGERIGRAFFQEMTPEEQRYFLELRVGKAFRQMMQSFNQMDREERRRIVERSLKQMQEGRGAQTRLEQVDPEIADKITQAGLEAYYEDASAETKLDLTPLLEEMQRSMSTLQRHRR